MITQNPAFHVLLISVLAGTGSAGAKEVKLSEVPAPVKATIDQRTAGGTIEEIEVETEGVRQVYSVEFKRNGAESEIKIGADGSYIGEDKDDDDDDDDKKAAPGTKAVKADDDDDDDDDGQVIDLAAAPEAVMLALTPLLAGATVKRMTKETEDGQVLYEAEYVVGGKERSAELTAAGAVVELEEVIAEGDVPAAARDAVKKLHPAGVVKKAESVTKKPGAAEQRYYELKVQSNGKMHEVKVDQAGKVLENDDDDDD